MFRVTFLLCGFIALCISENVIEKMKKEQVVPEVIDNLPSEVAEVTFPSGVKANMGEILTPTQAKDQPSVKWNAESETFYMVCMVDPDAPSRIDPKYREWMHWLVANIPSAEVSKGKVLTGYVGAAPPKGSGLHRYVILVYKQPKNLTFDEPEVSSTSGDKRIKFSIRNFAKKYGMEGPIAGNFFQAEWDEYVPVLNKQLLYK